MMSAIAIKNLKFSYGSTPVLDIDNFTVASGEFVFLSGASGSGKSTLLELLAGVLPMQNGELNILNEPLHKKTAAELDGFRGKNIGYIFQSFNLIPYLSVTENIKLPLMFAKLMPDKKHFDHLIDRLELRPYVNRPVTDLSVGQQQRVAVARALLKSPKVLLADEPTSALDYNHREKFLNLLFQVCAEEKSTLVFVSHDKTIEKLFHRSVSLESINRVQPAAEAIV